MSAEIKPALPLPLALPPLTNYEDGLEARAALLAEVNKILQFELPLDDYLWRYITHQHCSPETGAFVRFDLSQHKVFDPYAEYSRRSSGFGSSYEPVISG